MATEQTKMSSDEQLELVCWLIDRGDRLRATASSRAAMVVSADAIFLAGITFLLDKALSSGSQSSLETRVALVLCVGTTLLLVTLSIAQAANAVVFVWKSTRESLKLKESAMPPLPFINPRDTVRAFSSCEGIESEFVSTTKEQMIHYALGVLLMDTKAHIQRYQALRHAIRFLLIAVVPFWLSILIMLSRFFQ